MILTAAQYAGAALILAAFVAQQLRREASRSLVYLASNAVGAALLAWAALAIRQWGFAVLETLWASAALAGMWGRARARVKVSG